MKKLWNRIRKAFAIHNVSSSAWEQKLVGRNIHSVFTWCKDCGMKGCNIPFEDECGNCGSKNTVRYYDKETIDLLF
jgi:rRNA maturation endonuclease Nob1